MESVTYGDFDYVFKIILVGDCGVGKSSLLLRFADEVFQDSYLCTIGVDLRIRTVKIKDKIAKLHIWDTAGQERFKTICSHYYRGAEAIVFVYDVTSAESFSHVHKWYEEVKELCTEDCVFILIGNKSDMWESRAVSSEQGQALAAVLQMTYFETSAKHSSNVTQAFMSAADRMVENSHDNRFHSRNDTNTISGSDFSRSKPVRGKGTLSLNCFDCSIM